MVARVVLSNASYQFDRIYSYAVPAALQQSMRPGMRVYVPFGSASKPREALVVDVPQEDEEAGALKEITGYLDDEPIVSRPLLEVGAFLKRRYFCTYYEAFKTVMPPGIGVRFHEWVQIAAPMREEEIEARYKGAPLKLELLRMLLQEGGAMEYSALHAAISSAGLRKAVSALEAEGTLRTTYSKTAGVSEKLVRVARLAVPHDEAVRFAGEVQKKAPVQARMVDILCQNELVALKDLVLLSQGNYGAVRALQNKGILLYEEVAVDRSFMSDSGLRSKKFVPTPEQECVIEEVGRQLDKGAGGTYLLKGVTGSGKTEVYLQLIDRVLEMGRQAVVLVPEISLTPQTVSLFRARFGSRVAVFHSGLSLGERYDQWRNMREGRVDVAVGARSCVFAPFENIGIIIVDEEHETSYQSEMSPRYDAREVAAFRAKKNGAVLLLASATPSVESRYRCETGAYRLLTMDTRYNESAMPQIIVCDMRQELQAGNPSIFSRRLRDEIAQNIARGEQTILFLNRRGFSTFVSCRSCGYVVTCPNCSVSMTYHKRTGSLHCHYCGSRAEMVHTCPVCQSPHIRYFGVGTQKVEEEVQAIFPQASTIRMDFDTTASKFSHQRILRRFCDEKIDILIGTQMVAKGLDLHNVTLVGVVAADTGLNAGDFRSYERTFSQIVQVSGRAGRGKTPGRAVVQTYQPDSYAIQFAKNHDYDGFYENEIKFRKNLNYPPFCDILVMFLSDSDEASVKRAAQLFYETLSKTAQVLEHGCQVMMPQPCGVYRVGGKFRYMLQVKCPSGADLRQLVRPSLDYFYGKRKQSKVHVSVCINPANMY